MELMEEVKKIQKRRDLAELIRGFTPEEFKEDSKVFLLVHEDEIKLHDRLQFLANYDEDLLEKWEKYSNKSRYAHLNFDELMAEWLA